MKVIKITIAILVFIYSNLTFAYHDYVIPNITDDYDDEIEPDPSSMDFEEIVEGFFDVAAKRPTKTAKKNAFKDKSSAKKPTRLSSSLEEVLQITSKPRADTSEQDIFIEKIPKKTIPAKAIKPLPHPNKEQGNNFVAKLDSDSSDKCLQTFKSSDNPNCYDEYQTGQTVALIVPAYLKQVDAPLYAITTKAISERDYNIYCILSEECNTTLQKNYGKVKSNDEKIGLDLSDIENSISKYNHYCVTTGNCAGMFSKNSEKPITTLSYLEAIKYAGWLSKQTGKHYRLPNSDEWLSVLANENNLCSAKGEYINNAKVEFSSANKLSEYVNDADGLILGPVERNPECQVKQHIVAADLAPLGVSFHLVREIS